MPDDAQPPTEDTPDAPAAPEPKADEKPDGPKPPWGSDEDFKPDKAWKLIQNLRAEQSELKEKAKRLKDLEDKDKSEAQKLSERAAEAERKAQEAEQRALRLEVAASKGLTPAQAKRLVGATKEELEADADELLDTFGKPADDRKSPPSKPRERLAGGGDPNDEPEETDPRKLAARIPRMS